MGHFDSFMFPEDFASILVFSCDVLETGFHKFTCFLNGLCNSDMEFVFLEAYKLSVQER